MEKAANTVIQNLASDRPMLFTMLFNFYNHPQPFRVWTDRKCLHPRKKSLHVEMEKEVRTSIKEKGNEEKKGGGFLRKGRIKMVSRSEDRVRGPEPCKLYTNLHKNHDQTTARWPRPSLSIPCSTNCLVWAFTYELTITCGSLQIVSLQLAPSVGMACALTRVVESGFCQTRVRKRSFIPSNTLLLFRHRFPLRATPHSVNDTGSSRGFHH